MDGQSWEAVCGKTEKLIMESDDRLGLDKETL